METRSQTRKRKFSDCYDFKPTKLKNTFIMSNNSEINDSIKHNKSETIDIIPKLDVKNESKNDLKFYKFDISNSMYKADHLSDEICRKPIYYRTHLTNLDNKTRKCERCMKRFTPFGIQRHKCTIFNCEHCGKQCTIRSKFESHLRNHARIEARKSLVKTFFCETCNISVSRRNEKRHILTHAGKQKCVECGLILHKNKMSSHMKSHFKYVCEICGKIDSFKENHEKHIRVHEKAKRNPCPECDASFQYLVELARHITNEHRQIEDGKYECPFCKKIVSAIGHHLRTHDENPKQCERCNEVLSNYSAYKAHIRYHDILSSKGRDRTIIPKHLMTKAECFPCYVCQKTFYRKTLFLQHFKCHIQFVSYPCPCCSIISLTSFPELLQHISAVHLFLPEGQIKCVICDEIVTDISDHINIHKSDTYECELCSISFQNKFEFNKHYNRRHKLKKRKKNNLIIFMKKYKHQKLNFKKVSCFACSCKIRISHIKSHLSSHQRYQCIMCQKIFFTQKSLELHEQVHSKSSQRCSICSQSFTSHIRLMAHLKMFHKMAFSISKSCSRCRIEMC